LLKTLKRDRQIGLLEPRAALRRHAAQCRNPL
jgi:hypothetical protein